MPCSQRAGLLVLSVERELEPAPSRNWRTTPCLLKACENLIKNFESENVLVCCKINSVCVFVEEAQAAQLRENLGMLVWIPSDLLNQTQRKN